MEPGKNKMLGKQARDSNEAEKVAMGLEKSKVEEEDGNVNDFQEDGNINDFQGLEKSKVEEEDGNINDFQEDGNINELQEDGNINELQEDGNINDFQSQRDVLGHWALELYDDCGISDHTFFRAFMFVDQFLITNVESLENYKLLFVSALFVASQFEEYSPLSLRDCSILSGHLTDDFYSMEEILQMVSNILSSPNFELASPSILTFLETFINSSQKDDRYSVEGLVEFESLTYLVAELSFLDHRLTGFPPSIVAASALFLTRLTIRPDIHPWSSVMEQETNCKLSDLKDCIQVLHGKYKTYPHLGETRLVPPEEIPASYFEE